MNYKEVIESRYNRQNWQLLLHDIFGSKIRFWNTPSVVATSSPFAKQALWLGTITLSDEQTIAVYEVELSESVDIERNRRGIRDMLLTAWRNNGNAGAFMFCYRKNESVLRFSYVSESWKFADDGSYQKESTDTRRYTYLLGEGHRSRTAIQQFEKLRDSQLSLKDLTKAFSVEAVSDMFFDGYKKQYENIIFYITGKRMVKVSNKWEERLEGQPCQYIMRQFSHFPDPEKSIRDYVKKLMGRLVFLQFLQKKGWLGVGVHDEWGNGDPEFIQNLFASCNDKDHFIDNVMEPLFNDLNTEEGKKLPQYRTPYLNGGLFEREAADETDFPLPAQYMQSLLDFFASYNFTIDENDPDDAEVGVDPEMLGRIFENLLEDNKDKDAFYTPKEIVSYMCRESLIAYLQTGIQDEATKEAIRLFVTTHQIQEHLPENTDQLLKDVKICDPAIGSGAFPMGLLKELFLCRTALEGISQHQAAEIKKHIIQQNVYGVDIERGAVDIARLRFWLSLIVDEETPQALPNLDFKIMQGNSLLEQYKGVDLSRVTKTQEATNDFSQQSVDGDLFANTELPEMLRDMLSEYYDCTDHKKKQSLRLRIIDNVKQQLKEQNINVDFGDLDLSGNDQFFLWHTWFHDVFSKGGFDIVIGNPPYGLINKKQNQGEGVIVPEDIHEIYKQDIKYVPAKGGMLNIFRLFVVHGGDILQRNGVFCEIFPLAFTCDLSSAKLREHILNHYHIVSIEAFPERDNPQKRVFASAKMSVCILTFSKNTSSASFKLRINREPFVEEYKSTSEYTLEQIKKIDGKNFTIPLTETVDSAILVKVYSNSVPYNTIGKCYTGEIDMTFCKKAFTSNASDCKMLRGANVDRYIEREETSQGEKYYLNIAVLKKIKSGLNEVLFSSPRIIMQGITGVNERIRLKMTLAHDTFCANSINYCLFKTLKDAKCMLAIFNSKLLNYVFKLLSTNSNVNGYEVDNLPIPSQIPCEIKDKLIELVDTILKTKAANIHNNTSIEESKIDFLVYQLYGLTYDEVLVVDPETEITREDYEQ